MMTLALSYFTKTVSHTYLMLCDNNPDINYTVVQIYMRTIIAGQFISYIMNFG